MDQVTMWTLRTETARVGPPMLIPRAIAFPQHLVLIELAAFFFSIRKRLFLSCLNPSRCSHHGQIRSRQFQRMAFTRVILQKTVIEGPAWYARYDLPLTSRSTTWALHSKHLPRCVLCKVLLPATQMMLHISEMYIKVHRRDSCDESFAARDQLEKHLHDIHPHSLLYRKWVTFYQTELLRAPNQSSLQITLEMLPCIGVRMYTRACIKNKLKRCQVCSEPRHKNNI